MKLGKLGLLMVAAVVVVGSAANGFAAIAFTGNVSSGAAPTLDNSFGSLEFALNLGNGGAVVVDGVSFTNVSETGDGTETFFSGSGITVTGTTTSNTWNQASLGGANPWFKIAFPNGSQGFTINITGLDAGKEYQAQFLFGDPRTGPVFPYNQTVFVTDSSANSDSTTASFGSAAAGDEYALLTAEVSGSTSLSLDMTSGAPLISGIVLHSRIASAVPAPAALPAGLAAMGVFAVRRRRK